MIISLTRKRVLICEDEPMMASLLEAILTREYLTVEGCASDGCEAVEMALRLRPDIIIIEIEIPCLNGLEAARLILAEYSPCIIFVTASVDQDYQDQASNLRSAAYIIKPFHVQDFVTQLQAGVEKWQSRQPVSTSNSCSTCVELR